MEGGIEVLPLNLAFLKEEMIHWRLHSHYDRILVVSLGFGMMSMTCPEQVFLRAIRETKEEFGKQSKLCQ